MASPKVIFTGRPLIPVTPPNFDTPRHHLEGQGGAAEQITFKSALTAAEKRVSFSRHAIERINSRQLDFSPGDLARLDDTVERLSQKGAKESLIYLNDIALVVSVANRTVITAMDGMSARDNIFTNIDSAAIL